MTIDIRKTDPGDADEILALQKRAYQSEAELYQDFSIPPLTQTIEEMRTDMIFQVFLKAVAEESIVGSIRGRGEGDTCYIGRLIVRPDWQNRGIGTLLMRAIEEEFSGVGRFELFTGVKSEKNLYLYGKLGYEVFKTTPVNDRLSLVFLEKLNTPDGFNAGKSR